MASSFPGGLDNFTNPTASDALDSATVPHADQHANANDAIEAIESTLGVNPQGGSATVVARLDAVDSTVSGKAGLSLANIFTTGAQKIKTGADNLVGLILQRNSATQTANILSVTKSDADGGTELARIRPNGQLSVGLSSSTASTNSLLGLDHSYGGDVRSIAIKQVTSPTQDAIQVQPNASTTPIFKVDSAGAVTASNVTDSALTTAGIVTNTSAGLLGTVATVPVTNGGTGVTTSTGSGNNVLSASPTLTGTPTTTTAAVDTNTTQIASTAFVVGQGYAKLASPALTGTPTTTTATVDTNTTQIASTAFVLAQAGSTTPVVDGTAAVGTSTRWSRQDHVHPTDTSRAPSSGIAASAISGTAVTQADTGTVTSTMILDGTILNADINASAAIAQSKLEVAAATQWVSGTTYAVGDLVFNFGIMYKRKVAGAGSTVPASDTTNWAVQSAPVGTTSTAGPVQLNDSTSSISTTTAATPNAVKTAWTLASNAYNTATSALPTAGGIMTGAIDMGTNSITNAGSITATGATLTSGFSTAGVVHNNTSGVLGSSLIVDADVAAGAAIDVSKLSGVAVAPLYYQLQTTTSAVSPGTAIFSPFGLGTGSTSGVTLAASTTYAVDWQVMMVGTSVSTSHILQMVFSPASTATVTVLAGVVNSGYNTAGLTAPTALTATYGYAFKQTTNSFAVDIARVATSAIYRTISFKGYISIGTGGKIIPALQYASAGETSVQTFAGSYLSLTPMASNLPSNGTWS